MFEEVEFEALLKKDFHQRQEGVVLTIRATLPLVLYDLKSVGVIEKQKN